ncbi:MAG: hypothetical protein LDLANPLL_00326 [Turneriella sp.]|nr:hypothetical protein [Turneriella sp.]
MLEQCLRPYSAVPISHAVLTALLTKYKRPNDKITEWVKNGVLIALKRGLYLVGEAWREEPIALPLIANRLYGPSCVSLDYALSWHGLIPERVYEITSVCFRRSQQIENKLGRFSYTRIPQDIYPIGIRSVEVSATINFLIASPEKAICDKILTTRNLLSHSRLSMEKFLFDDLRLDLSNVVSWDLTIIKKYFEAGYKARQYKTLLNVLETKVCKL